ncbi:MAG: pyridoxamine 5'-phosphate oxidase family protein [Methanosarcinales archaeon]
MVNIPKEALEMLDNPTCSKEKPITWVSTVNEDGTPHMAPVCVVKAVEEDKLLIAVTYIMKTAENIKRGSKVAVGAAKYYDGFMVKGTGEIIDTGPLFEDVKKRVQERFKLTAKAALIVKVEEVYSHKPKSGKKKIA